MDNRELLTSISEMMEDQTKRIDLKLGRVTEDLQNRIADDHGEK